MGRPGEIRVIHVLPLTTGHKESADCWCNPIVSLQFLQDGVHFVVHRVPGTGLQFPGRLEQAVPPTETQDAPLQVDHLPPEGPYPPTRRTPVQPIGLNELIARGADIGDIEAYYEYRENKRLAASRPSLRQRTSTRRARGAPEPDTAPPATVPSTDPPTPAKPPDNAICQRSGCFDRGAAHKSNRKPRLARRYKCTALSCNCTDFVLSNASRRD